MKGYKMSKQINDTTVLRQCIMDNYGSIQTFTENVAKKTKRSEGVTKLHLYGHGPLLDEELKAYSSILKIPIKEINKMIEPVNKEKSPEKPINKQDKSAKQKTDQLKSIEGITSMYAVFDILNKNMQAIYEKIESPETPQETDPAILDTLDKFNGKLNVLTNNVIELNRKIDAISHVFDMPQYIIPISTDDISIKAPTKEDTPDEDKETSPARELYDTIAYDIADDEKTYANKIRRMAEHIAEDTGKSVDDVIDEHKTDMACKYNIEWDTLKKNYQIKHGSDPKSDIDMLWSDVLLSQIFFMAMRQTIINALK